MLTRGSPEAESGASPSSLSVEERPEFHRKHSSYGKDDPDNEESKEDVQPPVDPLDNPPVCARNENDRKRAQSGGITSSRVFPMRRETVVKCIS